MESNNFVEFQNSTETLDFNDLGENGQIENDKPHFKQESSLIDQYKDSMLCDSSARIVTSGFSSSCFKEDIVTFVNAGCEDTSRADSGIEFLADTRYQGGDVLQTDDCISDGGDYPFIYQSVRFGNFSYQFRDLPLGDYFIDLHFAEIINTYGPKGMRVFDVFIQDEKVLAGLDIFAIVGAKKPLIVVDFRTPVKEDGLILIRFEGLLGSAVASGICIRKASKMAVDSKATHEYLRCHQCAAEIVVPLAQERGIRSKAIAKYEKRIDELSQQCERKTNECYQAWMSLTAANKQLEKVRMELDNRLFKTYSLDQTVDKQAKELRAVSNKYEHDKKFWIMAISRLEEQVKELIKEHSQLSQEAHMCADSIPELTQMVSAVQMLVFQCEEFKVKYIEEQRKRKKLFNEVQEAKGNIRVFCRCRPLSQKEQSIGHTTVVDFKGAKDGELAILTNGSNKKVFRFDRVYMPTDDQGDVFVDVSPLATSVLDGYNVCIFAYGQTGTGKTFTMEGTEMNRGVNYRTLEQLFQIISERRDTFTYDISVSVLEVYNEQIRDLLDTSFVPKKLEIKQASEGSHNVPGAVEAKVENTKQVWEVLRSGSNARAVGSNNVNEHSSRSHCMLSVMVKAKNLINGEFTKSKLWLVDLAGSERLTKTDVQGDRLKEAQNINKSLSALGDVISALASKSSHIPYRNSKLTHLLQDSLGGNSKTLMLVQISPSDHDVGETLSSLNFASRVRGVELAPAKRQIDTSELQKTKMLLDKVRSESKSKDESIKNLEESLQTMENKARSKDQTYKSQQEKIRDFEEQLLNLQEKLKGREEACCSLQHKVKELELKLGEQQHNDSATLQQVSDLEKKLIEQVQESKLHSRTLQDKIKDLEEKLAQEHNTEFSSLHLKVKELEEKLKEKEHQLESGFTPILAKPYSRDETMIDADPFILRSSNSCNKVNLMEKEHQLESGFTPILAKPYSRDETMIEADPFILRSSNSFNKVINRPTLSKQGEVANETRRKREFKSGETENRIPRSIPLPDKKIRKSDPPKPYSQVSKPVRLVAAHTKASRNYGTQGTKEKDTTKRTWC